MPSSPNAVRSVAFRPWATVPEEPFKLDLIYFWLFVLCPVSFNFEYYYYHGIVLALGCFVILDLDRSMINWEY